jgi:glutaredoxin
MWYKRLKKAVGIIARNKGRPLALDVELLTRPGCSLCARARRVIMRVREEIPFDYREVDISDDEELERHYGTEIPVVRICGKKAFKYKVDEERLRKSLLSRYTVRGCGH